MPFIHSANRISRQSLSIIFLSMHAWPILYTTQNILVSKHTAEKILVGKASFGVHVGKILTWEIWHVSPNRQKKKRIQGWGWLGCGVAVLLLKEGGVHAVAFRTKTSLSLACRICFPPSSHFHLSWWQNFSNEFWFINNSKTSNSWFIGVCLSRILKHDK